MNFNTILSLEHFWDETFAAAMREAFPHLAKAFPTFPHGRELAKAWEVTQCLSAFREFNVLRPDAEVLGVGAGSEMTVFYLTNHVRRVFATDLYATNSNWKEADRGMLVSPERFAPAGYAWNPRRLVVQHMDACNLQYEDGTFDGVFSCGSIEHFGSLDNVARAAKEMARVLKPGGILALATEFRISGPKSGIGIPGAILFTPDMIRRYIMSPSGLTPVDDMVTSVSPATVQHAYPLAEAITGVRPRSIAMTHSGYAWTSGSISMRKAA